MFWILTDHGGLVSIPKTHVTEFAEVHPDQMVFEADLVTESVVDRELVRKILDAGIEAGAIKTSDYQVRDYEIDATLSIYRETHGG